MGCNISFIKCDRPEVPGEAFVSVKIMVEGKAYIKEDFKTTLFRIDIANIPDIEPMVLVVPRKLNFQLWGPERVSTVRDQVCGIYILRSLVTL